MSKPAAKRSRRPGDLRGSNRMAPFLFALAVVRFGLGALGWPTAPATILTSEAGRVETERRENGHTVTDVRHTVSIRYSYSALGRDFIGEGIQPYSYGMQNSAAAREQHERYRPGTAVRVAYDPDNPADAYLEPGMSSVSKMLLAVGVILALVGFWVRSISRRGAKLERQKP